MHAEMDDIAFEALAEALQKNKSLRYLIVKKDIDHPAKKRDRSTNKY